jgi:hypothetical protein
MIELLPQTFEGIGEVKGFKFTQLAKEENAYLYEVNTGASTHFEVFERVSSPICIDFVKRTYSDTDFKESYPKSNSFGIWAFSILNHQRAVMKLNELNERVKNRILETH